MREILETRRSRAGLEGGRPTLFRPSGRALLAGELGLGRAAAGGGVLYLGVDLAADEYGRAREVEPEQENYDRAERAVGHAVAVEVAQVDAEGEGDEQPEEDARQRAGRYPVPLLM